MDCGRVFDVLGCELVGEVAHLFIGEDVSGVGVEEVEEALEADVPRPLLRFFVRCVSFKAPVVEDRFCQRGRVERSRVLFEADGAKGVEALPEVGGGQGDFYRKIGI